MNRVPSRALLERPSTSARHLRAVARLVLLALVPALLLAPTVDAAARPGPGTVAAAPAAASWLEGIDVSHWQGTIDWTKVAAAGKRFAIIKATESTYFLDSQYATNRAGAKAAGLRTTGYHFARPSLTGGDPVPDAVTEADWFVDHLGLVAGDLPPALDLEASGGLSVSQLQSWVGAWLAEVYGRLGLRPMIYVSPSFWSTYLGNTSQFADAGYAILWVAHWTTASGPSVPGNNWGGKGWTFWQYSNSGHVPGIGDGVTTRVDLDRYNGLDLTAFAYDPTFALSVTPTGTSVQQGQGTTFGLNVQRSSFTSALTVSVSGLPAGAHATIGTNPVSGSSSTVTVTTSKTGTITPMGTYHISIKASGGGLSRSVPFTLTVTDGIFVSRQAGTSRYGTAATVATRAFASPVPVAYVTTGQNFPDGLAAAAAGGYRGGPVLLIDSVHGTVPSETQSALTTLKPSRIVVVGGSSVVSDSIVAKLRTFVSDASRVTRVSGIDRYATAATIATTQFGTGVPVAYVATGRSFPDALAGAAPAGDQGGPVLLVDSASTSIPSATTSALTKLAPHRIVVLGSTGVISNTLKSRLAAYTSGSVTRISGSNRYATAANIATSQFKAGVSVAYVATGSDFPDALAGAAAAGHLGAPVLLVDTRNNVIPAETKGALTTLKPRSIAILGSTGVVSSTIQTQLAAYVVR